MSDGLNKAILCGNLTDDGELRFTQGGQAVLNLRLAVNESYLDRNNERKERVEFLSIVVWGKRGEGLSKVIRKGMQIVVEGSIRTSSYDDKDGNKRYKVEIVASNVVLCGGRGQGQSAGAEGGGEQRGESRGGEQRGGGGRGGGYRGNGGSGGRAPAGPPAGHDDQGFEGGGGGSDDDLPF